MKAVKDWFATQARLAGCTTIGEKWPGTSSTAPVPPQDNPFKRNDQGQIKNITAVSKAIQSNEAQAREMCRQAGEPVTAWFKDNPQ